MNGASTAQTEFSSKTAVYKGLALASTRFGTFLYASNFHDGRVDVFNTRFHRVHLFGDFRDRHLPPGYAPFGIREINGFLYVSYALQKSEDLTTRSILTNSPRHLAKANLSVPFKNDRLLASLEAQYTSARETLAGDSAGGFTVVNLTLLSRNWKSGPSVSLSVFNLFDKRYGDPGGTEHVQDVIPQDGRSVRVQIRYEF